MPNYVLSLHVNFAARKSSLKKSQRVADSLTTLFRGGLNSLPRDPSNLVSSMLLSQLLLEMSK